MREFRGRKGNTLFHFLYLFTYLILPRYACTIYIFPSLSFYCIHPITFTLSPTFPFSSFTPSPLPSLLLPPCYFLSPTPSLLLYQQAILVELHPSYRQDRHFRHAARMTGKIYMPLRSQQRYAPSPPKNSLMFPQFLSHQTILLFPPYSQITPASYPIPCHFLSSHSYTFQYSSSSKTLVYFLFIDSYFILSLPFLMHL